MLKHIARQSSLRVFLSSCCVMFLVFFSVLTRVSADTVPLAMLPDTDGNVNAMVVVNGVLFIGGDFSIIDPGGSNVARVGLAAIDLSTGDVVSNWNPGVGGGAPAAPVVHAMAVSADGASLLVGGEFESVGVVLRSRLAAVRIKDSSSSNYGLPTDWDPDVTGTAVYSLTLSGDGNTVYVGGDFSQLGTEARTYIAAVSYSDAAVTPWVPNANGIVRSLLLSADNTALYAGGDFTVIGGQARNRLAALSIGSAQASAWNPNANGVVRSLLQFGTTLYVGGDFSTIAGANRDQLAALSMSTATATSWDPDANGSIRDMRLSVNGELLYVVGDFTSFNAGADTRNRLAALRISDASVTNWNPAADASVRSVAYDSTDKGIYFGGAFNNAGGQALAGLVGFLISPPVTTVDPVGGGFKSADLPTPITLSCEGDDEGASNSCVDINYTTDGSTWNQAGGDTVSITLTGTTVIDYYSIDNEAIKETQKSAIYAVDDTAPQTTALPAAGALTAQTGATVVLSCVDTGTYTDASALTSVPETNGSINAMLVENDILYIGGSFSLVDPGRANVARNGLAAIDLASGTVVANWNPGVGGASPIVHSMALSSDGNSLLVGGEFTSIASTPRNRLASIGIVEGSLSFSSVTSWNPDVTGVAVYTLLVSSSGPIYLGGDFTSVGGVLRNNVASIDPGTALVSVWSPTPNGAVYSLYLSGSTLYVAGDFTMVDSSLRNNLAAIGVDTATVSSWNPDPDAPVRTLVGSTGTLYVGGDFTGFGGAGGVTRNYLAAIDLSDASIDTNWNPDANGPVRVLLKSVNGDLLYVGGDFSMMGVTSRNRLAALDITSGSLDAWNPDAGTVSLESAKALFNSSANSPSGSKLIAGGSFTTVGGGSAIGLSGFRVILPAGCDKTYYTLDGSSPTTSSAVYTAGLTMTSDTTLKFFSEDTAGNSAGVVTEDYTVDLIPPLVTVSHFSGTYIAPLVLTLICDDGVGGSGCAQIFITTDGTPASNDSTPETYVGPIALTLTSGSILRVQSFDVAGNGVSNLLGIYSFNDAQPDQRSGVGMSSIWLLLLLSSVVFCKYSKEKYYKVRWFSS